MAGPCSAHRDTKEAGCPACQAQSAVEPLVSAESFLRLYARSEESLFLHAANEIRDLRRVLADIVSLADGAMVAANNDGAEYDRSAELEEAKTILSRR